MPREILLPVTAIPAAGTSTTTPLTGLGDVGDILLQAAFDYGSGGTTVDAYVQTSLDGGTTWIDIANFRFTTSDLTKVASVGAGGDLSALATPTDGTLTANTTVDGILGDQYRVKLVVVGTYAASTLSIFMQTRTDLGAPSTVGLSAAGLTALEHTFVTVEGPIGQAAPAASVSTVDATDTFTSPDNSIISVANTSTALLAAAGAGIRRRDAILYNTGSQTVSIREGAAPTAGTHFPLIAGAQLNVSTLLAVNGIVTAGTCTVAVLSEARS